MAEEKKKRVRPTVTEVRALRNELEATKENYRNSVSVNARLRSENRQLKKQLDSQLDGTSNIVSESDSWRKKYRELKKEMDALRAKPDDVVPKSAYDELNKKYQDIDLSRFMLMVSLEKCKAEKKTAEDKLDEVLKDYDEICSENIRLRCRGFWQRLFNK